MSEEELNQQARDVLEQLEKAATAYSRAARYARTDPKILVTIGDVRRLMTRYDAKMVGLDVATWEAALEINPGYRPAHERLLDAAVEATEVYPTDVRGFTRLGEKAESFAKVEPGNVRAQACRHIAVIGAWLANKAMPEAAVEEQVAALMELQPKDPTVVEIPQYIAKASLRLVRDRSTGGDAARARALVARAVDAFEKAPAKAKENPIFLYRQYVMLNEVPDEYADVAAGWSATTQPGQAERSLAIKARDEKVRVTLEAAVQRVRQAAAGNRMYGRSESEILCAWAMAQAAAGHADAAEAIHKELLSKRSFDPALRLEAARLMKRSGRHEEGVKLLSTPMEESPELLGFRSVLNSRLETQGMLELVDLRL
ncbi:MAG TPA: hypothetical protein VHP11_05120, partial [Tepidisphaeraceae bacterium]|nr:hypothetical protein [Tepidisphaeraceae bacterium]